MTQRGMRGGVTVLVTLTDIPVSMTMHEVFPNAPLQLVVFEVRFDRLASVGRGLLDALTGLVGDGEVQFGTANVQVVLPGPPESAMFHIVDKPGTLAITVWPGSLAVESSDYQQFSLFKEKALAAFSEFSPHLSGRPVNRIGLRYVDEIHPDPSPTKPEEWGRWVNPSLVSLARITDKPVVGLGGGVTVDIGDECMVSFRYSTVPGPAVQSSGLLRLRSRPNTPALLLDTDGYWQPSNGSAIDTVRVSAVVDRIHDGIAAVFHQVITDDSRTLFRATEQGG